MLDVSHNLIVRIPEEIGSAASLVKYDAFHVHFYQLIDDMGNLMSI